MSTADIVTDALKTLAPGVATALGGPLAGAAVAWIANRLGVPAKTAQDVKDALQGVDPLEREKLEQEFNRWFIEQQHKEIELYVKDVQDARARDSVLRTNGQRNHRADAMFAIAIIVVTSIFYAIWTKPEINEFLKGIITLLLGRFLGYIDSVYNFEFGTTRNSKDKDVTIKNLTQG